MENRTAQTSKSIVKNFVYSFSSWILPLCLSFVATSVIVKSLGEKEYGIYALILGFIGYSFTFSIGRAITKYVAEYRASGETEKIQDVISATFFVNIAVGIVGVLTICMLAGWLVRDVYKIEEGAQHKTIVGLYIASTIVFMTTLHQVFYGVLQGIQRFDVFSKIFNVNNLVFISGNLILAYSGYGLTALLVWNLLTISFFTAVFAYSGKKLLPEFGINIRFGRETLKLILRYSLGVVGYQLLANILLLFERGWITRWLGPESLTFYVVPLTLGMFLHGFIANLMIVIFPLASELKNEKEKLLRLYTKATKIVTLATVFLTTTLIVGNKLFLFLWMGENFAERSSSLLTLHMITFGLAAILTVSWQMTEGLGFPLFNFAVFSICLVTSVFLMIVLTQNFGNYGIAVARLVGFATIFSSVFYVEKWFFDKIQIGFWLKLLGILGVAAMFAALTEIFINANLPVSWLSFIFSAFCGGLAYVLVLWILGFVTTDEKLLIRGIFNR